MTPTPCPSCAAANEHADDMQRAAEEWKSRSLAAESALAEVTRERDSYADGIATMNEEALKVEARVAALEGALEAVVWCGWSSLSETPCCIECGDYKPRHNEGCAIARALLGRS